MTPVTDIARIISDPHFIITLLMLLLFSVSVMLIESIRLGRMYARPLASPARFAPLSGELLSIGKYRVERWVFPDGVGSPVMRASYERVA